MRNKQPLVITISRQLGSGGAYIGRLLSKKLKLFYSDREIIRKTAKELSLLEEDIRGRDEKLLSFWQSFMQVSASLPEDYIAPAPSLPTDQELFDTEAAIIEKIVKNRPAVIIGRCGFHILHDHPNHVRIFLHADIALRKARVQKLYHASEEEAAKMVAKSDKERSHYCKTFTGKDWEDSRNYDLSIDTGRIGMEQSAELILAYVKMREKEPPTEK